MGPMTTVPGVPLSSPPNVFTTVSPMTVQTPIEFQFDVNPVAGDSIAIPLDITLALPGYVPEPAAWAMMAVGLGLVGAGLRLGRKTRRGRLMICRS